MTTTDIDAIRQRVERYSQTGIGSGKTIQAIDLANKDVPALLAKVDELTAARDHMELNPTGTAHWLKHLVAELTAKLTKTEDQLTAANRRNDGLQNDLDSATKANTAWANETAAKDAVIDAAKTWRRWHGNTNAAYADACQALEAAVNALPTKAGAAR